MTEINLNYNAMQKFIFIGNFTIIFEHGDAFGLWLEPSLIEETQVLLKADALKIQRKNPHQSEAEKRELRIALPHNPEGNLEIKLQGIITCTFDNIQQQSLLLSSMGKEQLIFDEGSINTLTIKLQGENELLAPEIDSTHLELHNLGIMTGAVKIANESNKIHSTGEVDMSLTGQGEVEFLGVGKIRINNEYKNGFIKETIVIDQE